MDCDVAVIGFGPVGALLDAAVAPDGTEAGAVAVRPDRYVLAGAPTAAELAQLAAPCMPC